MKKLLLIVASVLLSLQGFAQYTPIKGDFSTELSFNPFTTDFKSLQLNGGKLKTSIFLSEKNALRLGIAFEAKSQLSRETLLIPEEGKYETRQSYYYAKSVYNIDKEDYTRTFDTRGGLSIGYERHFSNLERLDIYAGFEVEADVAWSKKEEYDKTPISEWSYNEQYVIGDYEDITKTTSLNLGAKLKLLTGANYYLYRSLYLGAELGIGAGYDLPGSSKKHWKTTNPHSERREGIDKYDIKQSTLDVSLFCEPSLHIGWVF